VKKSHDSFGINYKERTYCSLPTRFSGFRINCKGMVKNSQSSIVLGAIDAFVSLNAEYHTFTIDSES